MKALLNKMIEHRSLSREEARIVMLNMADGKYNDALLSAFMTVFLMRSITVDEISGFRDALLERKREIKLDCGDAIDIVGTGGDGKNTFNISTCSCFVVAGAGKKVVKHGNYGASSVSGASNVLEVNGVKLTDNQDILQKSLDESGVAFLHAPLFNDAMKAVAPVRKALGLRTFFNILGPLVNPALPKKQMLGVYNLKLMRLYTYLTRDYGVDCTVVHSLDGYDEISLTSPFKISGACGEAIVTPDEIGFNCYRQEELSGGTTVEDASRIFINVLKGKATEAQTNCVVANSAYALKTIDNQLSIQDALQQARISIESGNAFKAFEKFIRINS